ncbi:hypothetical protein BY458DRAFT_500287 [Sporodiniella umbellata]|nr:hypothetical protein BY458DRAFT_500287 [Sporodiniella umbellata]
MAPNSSILLHWYPFSPFAQKIAWALNFKNVNYKTVYISDVMPRPERHPIDGGFRKTPILQIGNHTFCDTKEIIAEIERRFPEPSFYPVGPHGESTEALTKVFARWLDSTVFLSIVSQLPADTDENFLKDRSAFFNLDLSKPTLKSHGPLMYPALMEELNLLQDFVADRTKNSKWVLGTEEPTLLDIHVGITPWFAIKLFGEDWLENKLPSLSAHLKRMVVYTKADQIESIPSVKSSEAIEIARSETEAEIESKHDGTFPISLGSTVSVQPTDTGALPATGKLVYSTAEKTIVEYHDQQYGTTVYLHFPVAGFIVIPS